MQRNAYANQILTENIVHWIRSDVQKDKSNQNLIAKCSSEEESENWSLDF